MWKVVVEQGQTVEEGQLICIIEAMKMENEITAHKAGTIAELAVKEGDPIASGATIAVIKSDGTPPSSVRRNAPPPAAPDGHDVLRAGLAGSTKPTVIFGVQPGGRDWVVRRGEVRVRRDGRIRVKVRGLVFADRAPHDVGAASLERRVADALHRRRATRASAPSCRRAPSRARSRPCC